MRARVLAIVSLLALPVALPAVARSDEPALDRAWSAPTPLDPGATVWDQAIAGLAPGRTVVVRASRPGDANQIVASVRDAATGFEAAQVLDAGDVYEPAVDASFTGGAVAAWVDEDDGAVHVDERRPGAAAFATAFSASDCCGDDSGNRPKVAVGRRGDAVVAWLARDGDPGDGGQQHVMASYRPVGGDFGAPETVAGTTAALLRDVALGADGTVALGWDEGGQATVAVRDPAGAWAVPEPLGAPDEELGWVSPALGVDGAGRVAAAWRESRPDSAVGPIELAYRAPGGTFGPALDTGLTAMSVGAGLGLSVSDAGELVLVAAVVRPPLDGSSDGGALDGVWAAMGTTVRGDLGPAGRISDFWGQDPSLAMSPRGDAVVAWDRCCPLGLSARRRLPGGSFGPAVDLAAPIPVDTARGGRILRQASIDEAGNAAAIWVDFEPEPDELFVGSDGPVITTLPAPVSTVPATLPAVTSVEVPAVLAPAQPVPSWPPAPPVAVPVRPIVSAVSVPRPAVAAPLALRAQARVTGTSARRRAEVRVRCSRACTARVAATLGATALRPAGVVLARGGEARVSIKLPARRRAGHRRAWLAVRVAATGSSGGHARSSTRVRVLL